MEWSIVGGISNCAEVYRVILSCALKSLLASLHSNNMAKKSPTNNPCPICLATIESEASLDTCGHHFCHRCIKKWSSKENTCPLCKQAFTGILRRARKRKTRRESVSVSRQRSQEDLLEDKIINALCGRSTRRGECSMLMAYALVESMAIED